MKKKAMAAMNKGRVWSRGGVKRKVWEDAQMECNLKERRKTESEVVKKKVLKKEKSECEQSLNYED